MASPNNIRDDIISHNGPKSRAEKQKELKGSTFSLNAGCEHYRSPIQSARASLLLAYSITYYPPS